MTRAWWCCLMVYVIFAVAVFAAGRLTQPQSVARDIADAAQAALDATTRQLALCEQRAAACAKACGP